jgi:hypothetical protein
MPITPLVPRIAKQGFLTPDTVALRLIWRNDLCLSSCDDAPSRWHETSTFPRSRAGQRYGAGAPQQAYCRECLSSNAAGGEQDHEKKQQKQMPVQEMPMDSPVIDHHHKPE